MRLFFFGPAVLGSFFHSNAIFFFTFASVFSIAVHCRRHCHKPHTTDSSPSPIHFRLLHSKSFFHRVCPIMLPPGPAGLKVALEYTLVFSSTKKTIPVEYRFTTVT